MNIEEIKHKVARQKGFQSWRNLYVVLSSSRDDKFFEYENEVAEEYAKQCCDEQKIACASNATANFNAEVDKESILSTPNVAEKP